MANEPVFEHESSIDATPASSPEQTSGQQPAPAASGDPAPPAANDTPTPSGEQTPAASGGAPGVEKRIGQLTARNRSLETELAEIRARAAFLEGQMSAKPIPAPTGPGTESSAVPLVLPPPPDPANYEDDIAYQRDYEKWWRQDYPIALTAHAREQLKLETQQTEAERNRRAAEAKAQQNFANFSQKLDAEYEKDPEFYDMVHDPRLKFLNGPLFQQLQESDNPVAILRHLAANPQEGFRLYQMNEFGIARELGKLEAKLTTTPQPDNKVSGAPPPINALKGNEALTGSDPLTSGTDDEFFSKIKIA